MAHLALVTTNNGGFLIELVLKQPTGRLPRYCNHLYYPVVFFHTLVMISDGCCDWNPAKHMTHVTKKFVTSI